MEENIMGLVKKNESGDIANSKSPILSVIVSLP